MHKILMFFTFVGHSVNSFKSNNKENYTRIEKWVETHRKETFGILKDIDATVAEV